MLIPLLALDFGGGGIREVSLSLAALMGISFVLSCLFLPSYAIGTRKGRRNGVHKQKSARGPIHAIRRSAQWIARRIITACAARFTWPLVAGAGLAALGIWAVASIGIDLDPPPQTDSIPVHVECESGASIESVDAWTSSFSSRLAKDSGSISSPEHSQARERRSGSGLQRISRGNREVLSKAIRTDGRGIPGGFAYLPEGVGATERALEIAITGDDDATLKEYASQAAQLLGGESKVKEVVLNFKEPAPSYVFKVDPERAAAAGATAEAVAGALRWHLYGPVALKWICEERGMDLRVMGTRSTEPTLLDLAKVPVPTGNESTVPAQATGAFSRRGREASSIG